MHVPHAQISDTLHILNFVTQAIMLQYSSKFIMYDDFEL